MRFRYGNEGQWSADAFNEFVNDNPYGGPRNVTIKARTSGWFNFDYPYTCSLLSLRVLARGSPVAGALVYSEGSDYRGNSYATSDADGKACVNSQFMSKVSINVRLAAKVPQGEGIVERGGELADMPAICLGHFDTGEGGKVLELGDLDVCAPKMPARSQQAANAA